MSIKSEREPFNWKAFIVMMTISVFILGSTHTLLTYYNPDKVKDAIWYWNKVYWIFLYPALICSLMINNFGRSRLTITAFDDIENFNAKLLARIEKFNVSKQTPEVDHLIFYPNSKFKKIFSYWFNAERMEMKIESDRIQLIGPIYRMSQVEDTLTWNKDFKK